MKMKHINKILTSILSVSMLLGGALPVQAAEEGVDIDAPIYSLDIMQVIVPTTYAVAFNPDGLQVKTGTTVSGGDGEVAVTSSAQILSKNFGIINKSSKDKLITITLNVADQNTDSSIVFVNSKEEVDTAEDGEYKVHLTVIPANGTEVTVGGASADEETTAAALNDVTMAQATGNAVTLMGGENYIAFKLEKAAWTPKAGNELTLGGTSSNNVAENFEITGLAEDGKSITAFTFGGEMNANTDWSKLTQGVKITVVYGNENAASGLSAISGTGAMIKLNIAPTFATGKGIGQINITRGTGDDGLQEITRIDLPLSGKAFNGYKADKGWPAATEAAGVITLSSQFMAFWNTLPTVEATVTYVTNGGVTKTTKVNVKGMIVNEAPTFTTGSGIGQINYTEGAGDDGLKEIKKIEMVLTGKTFDGYNADKGWVAATDKDGVITFASSFITFWKDMATSEATITYETNSGDIRTFSVDVKCK